MLEVRLEEGMSRSSLFLCLEKRFELEEFWGPRGLFLSIPRRLSSLEDDKKLLFLVKVVFFVKFDLPDPAVNPVFPDPLELDLAFCNLSYTFLGKINLIFSELTILS